MNIGIVDRAMRLSVGMGVVFFDYLATANWEIIFLLIAVVAGIFDYY